MTGRGHVEPGGQPLVEQLSPELTMIKMSVGPMDNNAYVLQPRTGAPVLIDAANDADRLVAAAGDPPPGTIVTTHRHHDHWQALADLTARWSPQLYAGSPDLEAIQQGAGVRDVTGVWDADEIPIGDERLEILGLVGHTPGSIVIIYRGDVTHLFTGDGLFPGGVGKTGSAADFTSLIEDVEHKIFNVFEDDTVIHPGHGDDTTVGRERPHLDEWRSRGW
ncbi:MBL fold metallo-hydrolase [Microlunatus soli]|uniref:Glyoxylase, beta-lactamase superfamily II n=1 Tax=Microlunatus soli TaxID=630515 RepID=A0A1H1P855_9ACTN|nr:MBL fold metallo-hydrolase [Microlunatus soli]SDS07456.1 Glyoxylase, beta-lactamase superfamily II [Microlunatus soli]